MQGLEKEVIITQGPIGINLQNPRRGRGAYLESFNRDEKGRPLPTEASGILTPGDMLCTINGTDVSNWEIQRISESIRKAGRPLVVTFVDPPQLYRKDTTSVVEDVLTDLRKLRWLARYLVGDDDEGGDCADTMAAVLLYADITRLLYNYSEHEAHREYTARHGRESIESYRKQGTATAMHYAQPALTDVNYHTVYRRHGCDELLKALLKCDPSVCVPDSFSSILMNLREPCHEIIQKFLTSSTAREMRGFLSGPTGPPCSDRRIQYVGLERLISCPVAKLLLYLFAIRAGRFVYMSRACRCVRAVLINACRCFL